MSVNYANLEFQVALLICAVSAAHDDPLALCAKQGEALRVLGRVAQDHPEGQGDELRRLHADVCAARNDRHHAAHAVVMIQHGTGHLVHVDPRNPEKETVLDVGDLRRLDQRMSALAGRALKIAADWPRTTEHG